MTGCGADVCMAGCYGDYGVYLPATDRAWPRWFRNVDDAVWLSDRGGFATDDAGNWSIQMVGGGGSGGSGNTR